MRRKGGSVAGRSAQDKRAYWREQISQWRVSGQSQKAFCGERGIAQSTFQWWRGRLSRSPASGAAVSFAPLPVQADSGTRACAIEIELRSRTRLRFEGEAALRALDRLIERIR